MIPVYPSRNTARCALSNKEANSFLGRPAQTLHLPVLTSLVLKELLPLVTHFIMLLRVILECEKT